MRVAVVGMGHVGLVTAVCLADTGNQVIGVDSDTERMSQLQQGFIPFYEPGLRELLERNTREGRLRFTSELGEAVRESRVIFIAVGTPTCPDGTADLTQVVSVAEGIANAMDGPKIVVLKSTVPVGTADLVRERIANRAQYNCAVVSNPEFLREGAALNDFLIPDRVVIGTADLQAAEILTELYAPFVRTGKPLLIMDNRSAEMTKYASNLMLAARISIMNELAWLCERLGADIDQVRRGVGTDSRIGPSFLLAGIGYGGSCLPKDIRVLIRLGRDHDRPLRIAEAIEATNLEQRTRFFEKIAAHFQGDLRGRRMAVWGLAFKPETDDMREAPSVTIIGRLLDHGVKVVAYDPRAKTNAQRILGDRILIAGGQYDCLEEADALIIITEWSEFRNPDFERMKSVMKTPVIFDGRNIYEPLKLKRLGFAYYGVGRPCP